MRRFAFLLSLVIPVSFAATGGAQQAAERITAFSLTPVTTLPLNRHLAAVTAAVVPGTEYVVEDSPNLVIWNRVSPTLRPTTAKLEWSHIQDGRLMFTGFNPIHPYPGGDWFTRRFYRLRTLAPADTLPAPGAQSVTPVGRLLQPQPGGPHEFTTLAGWRIVMNGTTIIITSADGRDKWEIWGSNNIHENLNGKHIKDWMGSRRTLLLPGGATITLSDGRRVPTEAPTVKTVSIYDGSESHRVNTHTNTVEMSHLLTRAGEAAEADGETSRIWSTGAGVYVETIYTQDAPATGQPLPQEAKPLGRTYGPANPNNVTDYFDDPRLGHT